MKLFPDENLSPQHAFELRTEGHDAIAVLEAGLSGATDEQVLRFAVENGRVRAAGNSLSSAGLHPGSWS